MNNLTIVCEIDMFYGWTGHFVCAVSFKIHNHIEKQRIMCHIATINSSPPLAVLPSPLAVENSAIHLYKNTVIVFIQSVWLLLALTDVTATTKKVTFLIKL